MEIVKISESNYQEILDNYTSEDYSSLSDCIGYLPQKNEIISQFIVDLKKKKGVIIEEIIKEHLESNRVEVLISSVIYSKRLGINLNFEEIKINPIEKSGFEEISLQMSEVGKIKVLEYLERIRQFALESEGIRLGDGELFVYFFCIAILKNFRFSVSECLRELKDLTDDQIILSCITFLSDSEEPAYLLSLLLKIMSLENEAQVLRLMGFMDKGFRDLCIAMIHEHFLLKRITSQAFSDGIKQFIDDETVDVMLRLVNVDNLSAFLPEYNLEMSPIKPLRKEDFTISKDKEKFFNDFCLLGSPSVSHFLSYLEIYKKHFILKEEEQRLFVDIFSRIFVDRKSFSRIILSKMVLFKILDKKFI